MMVGREGCQKKYYKGGRVRRMQEETCGRGSGRDWVGGKMDRMTGGSGDTGRVQSDRVGREKNKLKTMNKRCKADVTVTQ